MITSCAGRASYSKIYDFKKIAHISHLRLRGIKIYVYILYINLYLFS